LPGSSGLGIGGSDSADRCTLAVVGPLNDRFRERQPVLRQRGQTENFEIIYRTKSCELGVIDRDYRSLCPAPTRARLCVAQETAMTPQR